MGQHRNLLSACLGAALLAGCSGGNNDLTSLTPTAPQNSSQQFTSRIRSLGLIHSQTFNYTGAQQTFKVPKSIGFVALSVSGAGLAGGSNTGGIVEALLPVKAKETLYLFVGGSANGYVGGYNGGADGGVSTTSSRQNGPGGNGASDVRVGGIAFSDRVIVAGGSGGNGCDAPYQHGTYGTGGLGGASVGGNGTEGYGSSGSGFAGPGLGGTQNAGGGGGSAGPGGEPGRTGALGKGENGGGVDASYSGCGGGGGGGGYYGGGGGGGTGYGGSAGGGGGSSYAGPTAQDVLMVQGTSAGGSIVVYW